MLLVVLKFGFENMNMCVSRIFLFHSKANLSTLTHFINYEGKTTQVILKVVDAHLMDFGLETDHFVWSVAKLLRQFRTTKAMFKQN